MQSSARRWFFLGTALATAIVVATLFRPADSLGENPVARRDDGVAKAIAGLNQALQSESLTEQQLTNPFRKPVKPDEKPSTPVEQPRSGAQMTGWARLNSTDYALVATAEGEKYVQVGDMVGGWKVAQVSPDQMVLTQGQVREVVKLKNSFSVTPLKRN